MVPVHRGKGEPAEMVINILSILLILAGLLFFLGAVVGIVRFPDFYTRMHAAGKGDTLSTMLITGGMALQVFHHFDWAHWTDIFVVVKIMAIGILIMLTSPTSTHALMQAGYDDGIEPVIRPAKKGIASLDDVPEGDELLPVPGAEMPEKSEGQGTDIP
jgi:multicomponent Na+:H+ antiporter subunit G